VIPTVNETKEKSDINKSKNTEKDLSKISLKLSVTNAKVMSMLLPTAQTHLRLPSMMQLTLKHLSLIVLFL